MAVKFDNIMFLLEAQYQQIYTAVSTAKATAVAKKGFTSLTLVDIQFNIEQILEETDDGKTLSENQLQRVNKLWRDVAGLLAKEDHCVIV